MKTLSQIRKKYAEERAFTNWAILVETYILFDHGSLFLAIDRTTKQYAIEVAKQTQQNIADATDNDSIGKYIKILALDESKIPSLDN